MIQQLSNLSAALLALHKELLEVARVIYESEVEPIQSPNHFLQLLTGDPWFEWLSPLSQLIAAMDEAVDSKKPVAEADIQALVKQARDLLVASENGVGFSRHYFIALQANHDVVLAHANVVKMFEACQPSK
jgi:hypothetical protein